METLYEKMIRLAYTKPHLRKDLLPIIKKAASLEDFLNTKVVNPETGREVKVKTLQGKPEGSKGHTKYKQLLEKHDKGKKKDEEKGSAKKPSSPNIKITVPKETPKLAHQEIKSPEALFKQAKEAHEQQLDWLNRGKGIDAAIGGVVHRRDEKGAKFEDEGDKPLIVIGPMKEEGRSKQKVEADYKGDWTQLKDVVRSSIAVQSFADIPKTIAALEKAGMKLAQQPKDRFKNPTEAGYRDISLSVVYPNGHIGELQIHLKDILVAKTEGHKFYEKVRTIEAKAEKEGKRELTKEERAVVDEANAKMRVLYDAALKKAST